MLQWCGDMGVAEWLVLAAAWGGIIALAIWVVTRLFPTQRDTAPLELLDARLARGEIDADAYLRARDALGSPGPAIRGVA